MELIPSALIPELPHKEQRQLMETVLACIIAEVTCNPDPRLTPDT